MLAAVLTAMFLAAVSAAGVLSNSHLIARPVPAAAALSATPTATQAAPTTTWHSEND